MVAGSIFYLLLTTTYQLATWPYRLTVRTPASQAVNPGSIPGRVTFVTITKAL